MNPKATVHHVGYWAGARHLYNRGIPFETAYRAIFGRAPK